MSNMPPVTVLIVDDHPSFRATARLLLEVEGYDVIGEAEDGETGISAARELRPDLVLLDVNLPGIDGFVVARELSGVSAGAEPGTGPAVILTSSRDPSDYGTLVSTSGARGFIPKADLSGDSLAALLR